MTIAIKKRHGSRMVPQFLRDMLQDCQPFRRDWPNRLMDDEAPFMEDIQNQAWTRLSAADRALWLTGQLYNDSGIMPSSLCEDLNLSHGSTYAMGARRLRQE